MTLNNEITAYNHSLDTYCRKKWGVSVKVYKVVKAMTQLAGAGAGIYAMSLGADPLTAFVLITAIISGPEAFEYVAINANNNE